MRTDEILKVVNGPDILDVGCAGHIPRTDSPHWLHGRLREKYPSLTGLDLNEKNIRLLQELGYERLYVDSAEDFSFQNSFDTIVAGELIEHLSNPGSFLNRCRAHLKNGGRVVLSTPYVFSLLYILYAFLKYPNTCQNEEHTVWFCPKTLVELASRSGFRVTHWELIEDYELDNPSQMYRIFARFMLTIGHFLIPTRLRKNTMLFVLESD
jgi:2-polyprenyl-3-methyl-5-hydroxy-6-metoxy-1,4-benzoquinol methylase